MCVEWSSLASRLGYQQLMTSSNSPIVGLSSVLTLFLVFYFDAVYISKEMFL